MPAEFSNLLLASLSPESCEWLVSRSIPVQLPVKTTLYVAETTPDFAYLLTSGMASVVTVMADGKAVEVGVIGCEGIVGALHLLGSALVPTECFIQMAATALRIRFSDLRTAFRGSEEIRSRVLELVQQQALSLGQLSGCNRLHEQEERLARWLLMVQDRTQTGVLAITQESLAEMLGSKRTTVTVVAGTLQRAGLIEYTRGKIKILDRSKLEEAACSCYGVIKKIYGNLYQQPWLSHEAAGARKHSENGDAMERSTSTSSVV